MIRCLSCGDIIESTHIHDYKVCRCGNVAVDGGQDYLRRSYPVGRSQSESYEELSQWKWDVECYPRKPQVHNLLFKMLQPRHDVIGCEALHQDFPW